jgi:hypothetical protein
MRGLPRKLLTICRDASVLRRVIPRGRRKILDSLNGSWRPKQRKALPDLSKEAKERISKDNRLIFVSESLPKSARQGDASVLWRPCRRMSQSVLLTKSQN